MNVLFIGGTGNISTECASLLHDRGHKVFVLTRGLSSIPPQYTAIQADRTDWAAMRRRFAGLKPDVVINFLGYELSDVQLDYELCQGSVQ